MPNKSKSFAFLVLCHNQEDYIIEHLESIKYLSLKYGHNINIDIIINDDFSNDSSPELIKTWLDINRKVFRNIKIIFNTKRIGTCKSVINLLNNLKAQACKLTAADDVYSYENIFKYSFLQHDIGMTSGLHIKLINGVLIKDIFEIFSVYSSFFIYQNSISNKFKLASHVNAPNLIYNIKFLNTSKIKRLLSQFELCEDWPIQIFISESQPTIKFKLIDKVLVYYRRTSNSVYIQFKKRFLNDKIKIFKYLINKEKSKFVKIILINRLFFLKFYNFYIIKYLFNISYYIYIFSSLLVLNSTLVKLFSLNIPMKKHIKHYEKIKSSSIEFKKLIKA
jgi:hypothetical protein